MWTVALWAAAKLQSRSGARGGWRLDCEPSCRRLCTGTLYCPSVLRVEREHRFDASVEAGFAYITDPANWPEFWPGFVQMQPGSKWSAPGDESTIVVKLLGRDVELFMILSRLVPNEVVEYESSQPGLPDAHHERHFRPDGEGFRYRLVVEYEPRAGLRGLYDRFLVRRGVERALQQTVTNLESKLTA